MTAPPLQHDAPTRPSRSGRGVALRTPLAVGAAGLAAAVLLHVRDPHQHAAYGLCPFQFLTGLACPGCGGLRAVNDLTHLDLAGAASSNLLAVVLVAVLAVFYLRWLVLRWRGHAVRMIVLSPRVGAVVIGVTIAFTVLRNTPLGAWLAP